MPNPNNNNIIDLMEMQRQQGWSAQVDTSVDDNPDDAARSGELAEATGADPGMVYENRDEFERNTRQNMAHSVVENDPYLQRYIMSHPLAAKISNDDYGNLSAVNDSYASAMGLTKDGWLGVVGRGTGKAFDTGIAQTVGGVGRLIGSESIAGLAQRFQKSIDEGITPSEEEQQSFIYKLSEGAGQLMSVIPGLVAGGPVGAAIQAGFQGYEAAGEKAEAKGVTGLPKGIAEAGEAALNAAMTALPLGKLESIGQAAGPGLINWGANALKEALATGTILSGTSAIGDIATQALEKETIDPSTPIHLDMKQFAANMLMGTLLGGGFAMVKPFINEGHIPMGVHPVTDAVNTEYAKAVNDKWDEAFKSVQASNTKERSPAMIATLLHLHPEDTVGIDGNQVLKMYGDKPPSADDGMLGWVPNINAQLAAAATDGGDIRVPIADYLAHADKDFDKEVHDFRRFGNAPSLDDVKNLYGAPDEEGEQVPPGAFAKSDNALLDATRASIGMDKILPDPLITASTLPNDAPGKGFLPDNYKATQATAKMVTRTIGGHPYQARSFSAKELLANLRPDIMGRPTSALYKFFGSRLAEIAGDTPVDIVTKDEMARMSREIPNFAGSKPAGFQWSDPGNKEENRIVVQEDLANGDRGAQFAQHLLVHEMAHAISVDEIKRNPEVFGQVSQLLDETKAWIAANNKDLLDHPGIAYGLGTGRYTGRGRQMDTFEYISQAFSEPDFQDVLAKIPLSKALADRIGKPGAKTIWEAARHIVKKAFEALMGKSMPPTALDAVFSLGNKFQAAHMMHPEQTEKFTDIEQPMPTPEERQLFRDQKALGYTKDHWDRIRKKVSQQKQADNEFHAKQALKDATRRATQTWQDEAKAIRPEAAKVIQSRPDIAADRYLRLGDLYGNKVGRKRLDQSKLTADQKKQLDPELYGKSSQFGGKDVLSPDEAASMFGYHTGSELVSDLALLHLERQRDGLTPTAHFAQAIDREVDRRLRDKFGSIEQMAFEDAKDHVINDGQYDLLHEDTLRLAQKFGFATPFTKIDIQSMARSQFDSRLHGDVKSVRFADQTGRIGRLIEREENLGNAKEVMRLAQQREISFYETIEARKYEKQVAREGPGSPLAKRLGKASPPSWAKNPESSSYWDFAQLLMKMVGMTVRRKDVDLANAIDKKSFKDFSAFIDAKEKEGEDIPVYDGFFDGKTYHKPFDQLTVGEAKSFMNVLKSLNKYGLGNSKYYKDGVAHELEPVLTGAVDNLKTFDPADNQESATGAMSKALHGLKVADASLRNIERLLNRIDRNNPRGTLNQYLVRPITEAANFEEAYLRRMDIQFKKLGNVPDDIHKLYSPPIQKTDGSPLTINQLQKLKLMLHMGTEENWSKLTKGRNTDPDQLTAWVMQNTTKEEWKFVNGIWRIFDEVKDDLDRAYINTTGTPPAEKTSRIIETPFGTFKGGYTTLTRDQTDLGSKGLYDKSLPGDKNYFRDAIPNPHAKAVTGVTYPVSLNLDTMGLEVRKMVHDVVWRQILHEAKKLTDNTKFRQAMIDHYGKEYEKSMQDWMTFLHGADNYNSDSARLANSISEFFRKNTIGYLVGGNPSTVLKHGPTAFVQSAMQIGAKPLLKAYYTMLRGDPKLGMSVWNWSIEQSEELQRRERYWDDTFGVSDSRLNVMQGGVKSTYKGLNDLIIRWGAKPVAFSDKLSAVPLWYGAYTKAIDEGETHGEAVFEADRAVRFAHGSTASSNLPAAMRGGGIHKWFTSLYGFFGTVMQNRMELAFMANDTWKLMEQNKLDEAAKKIPIIAAMTFAYVIAPTAIEEWVTGLTTDDRRGWLQHLAWATAGGLANSVLGARDLVHMLEYSSTGEGGLLDAAIKPFQQMAEDVHKGTRMISRQEGGKLIQDIMGIAGPAIGVPKIAGNAARYGWDTLIANKNHPRTILFKNWHQYGDAALGIVRGQQKLRVEK